MIRSERNKCIQNWEIVKPLTRIWFWPNIQIKNKQLSTLGKFPKQKHKQCRKGAVFSDQGSTKIVRIVGEGGGHVNKTFQDSVRGSQDSINILTGTRKKCLWYTLSWRSHCGDLSLPVVVRKEKGTQMGKHVTAFSFPQTMGNSNYDFSTRNSSSKWGKILPRRGVQRLFENFNSNITNGSKATYCSCPLPTLPPRTKSPFLAHQTSAVHWGGPVSSPHSPCAWSDTLAPTLVPQFRHLT